MKRFGVFCLLLLWWGAAIAEEASDEIPNLNQPRPNVFTSGQPTKEGMSQMASRGVKTVVNLRPHSEPGARDETEELSVLQIKYYNLPITPDSFTLETVAEFARILRDSGNQTVLIHCTSANRVGGLWLAHRILYENADTAKALKEAREIGMKPSMEDIVLRRLRDSQPPKQ